MDDPPDDTVEHLTDLHVYYLVAACLSIVFCLFVILSYIRFPILRHHPSSLVFWRTIFDTFFALTFIVLYALPIPEDPDDLGRPCSWLGPFFHFTLLGSQSWYFMITVDLLYALLFPFSDLNSMVKWYHLYVWGTSLVAVVIISAANQFDYRPLFQVCWIHKSEELLNVFSWLLFFIPTIFYAVISSFVAVYAARSLKQGLKKTAEIRKLVISDGAKYNAVFLIYWLIAFILYQLLYATESNAGDVDSNRLFALLAITIGGLGIVDAIAWFITNKKIFQAWYAGEEIVKEARQKKPINLALREEILYYTTAGITQALEQSMENEGVSFTPPVGSNYYATALKPKIENGFNVQPGISEVEIGNYMNGESTVQFLDYSPQVFRFIRQRFGISSQAYKDSINGDSGTMLAKYSEGRSAAFFFFTADSHYIVKTLEKGEMELLLKILPKYTQYMEENPNSLINRFVGLHSVYMYHTRLYLIVMESVFLTDELIHERYDLKGSWTDRHTKDSRESGIMGFSTRVMKDSDLHKSILLSERNRELLMTQAAKDSKFLCDLGIMDYSLLVGVRYVRQGRLPVLHSHVIEMKNQEGGEDDRDADGDGDVEEKSEDELLSSQVKVNSLGSSLPRAEQFSNSQFSQVVSMTTFRKSDSHKTVSSSSKTNEDSTSNDLEQPLMNVSAESPDFAGDIPVIVGLSGGIQSEELPKAEGKSHFQVEDGGLPAEVVEGPGTYYFGIIDILQEWNFSKKMERFLKTVFLRKDPDGVSCVTPIPYQKRFAQKVSDITEGAVGDQVVVVDYSRRT